jgi:hypothetical protein
MEDGSIDDIIRQMRRMLPGCKIERVASDSFRVNKTLVRFKGGTVTYGRNKVLFNDVHELIQNFDKDGIIN